MDSSRPNPFSINRRNFFGRTGFGLASTALATLVGKRIARAGRDTTAGLPEFPNFAPTAKRVISLFQSGGPSTIDLFDYKSNLQRLHGTPIPDSVPAAGTCLHEFWIRCNPLNLRTRSSSIGVTL